MKKTHFIILSLALPLTLLAGALPPRGVPVQVRLTSGTTQNADFLGMVQDTILLGGTVHGEYTTVRLHRSLFAWIKDPSGNLLNPDSILLPAASATPDSAQVPASPPAVLPQWQGKTLLFALDCRPIDSALAYRLTDITYQMLLDQGRLPERVRRRDFPECNNDCILSLAEKSQAEAVITGIVRPAPSQDSLEVELHQLFFRTQKVWTAAITLSARNATREILSDNRWINLLAKTSGQTVPEKKKNAYIYVETDPDGATLARKGGNAICRTPCAFATTDTGRIALEAYWRVDNHLWAANTSLLPIPGDTAKASLKLSRVQPEVEVLSTPSGAEIFQDETISAKSKSSGTTPKIYTTVEPGPGSMHLWKPGYKDTLVTFHVNALGKTVVSATLTPLENPQALESQQALIHARNRRNIGFTLMGSSIAPLVAGGILLYLADKDYQKARDIRDELDLPSSAMGSNYEKKVQENHDYADRGDSKLHTGIGMLCAAAAMLGIGWVFTF